MPTDFRQSTPRYFRILGGNGLVMIDGDWPYLVTETPDGERARLLSWKPARARLDGGCYFDTHDGVLALFAQHGGRWGDNRLVDYSLEVSDDGSALVVDTTRETIDV